MSDDISFCLDAYDIPCDKHDCERHPCNIVDRLIPHSYMSFYGTEFCEKGKRMNFSDKVKGDEFMNLPEVEDDIEEEDESESFLEKIGKIDFPFLPRELSREEDLVMRKDKIDRNIELFQYINERLIEAGYEDKTERLEIIKMIMN